MNMIKIVAWHTLGVFVIMTYLVITGCVAQQADVVRIKRDLDARITKLDKSKSSLQEAVKTAHLSLQKANSIIAQQRVEIQELLVARAEVMDQVTTIKDGDLSEVRGAIDQSEHQVHIVAQRVEELRQERDETRERDQVSRQAIQQMQKQLAQQGELLTAQAEKIAEFQTAFVNFQGALDTVRGALVEQESGLGDVQAQLQRFTEYQGKNSDVTQANLQEVKRSVASVVTAFEKVNGALADRIDEHERRLSEFQAKNTKSITSPSRPSDDDLYIRESMRESAGQFKMNKRVDRAQLMTGASLSSSPRVQEKSTATGDMLLYEKNYNMLKAGNLPGALIGFSHFREQHPDSLLAANAQYWIGECYYGQQEYAKAIQEFKRVFAHYPSSNKVPAALLKIGYSHLGLQNSNAARSVFRRLVRTYPKSRAAAKAYARLTEAHQQPNESS